MVDLGRSIEHIPILCGTCVCIANSVSKTSFQIANSRCRLANTPKHCLPKVSTHLEALEIIRAHDKLRLIMHERSKKQRHKHYSFRAVVCGSDLDYMATFLSESSEYLIMGGDSQEAPNSLEFVAQTNAAMVRSKSDLDLFLGSIHSFLMFTKIKMEYIQAMVR
jgi:hypothetical protein